MLITLAFLIALGAAISGAVYGTRATVGRGRSIDAVGRDRRLAQWSAAITVAALVVLWLVTR